MFEAAKWIQAPIYIGDVCPEFKRELALRFGVRRATARVSAFGVYELFISGNKVGRAFMAPGWTNYENHIQYQEYDISELVRDECTLSIRVGRGWALGRMGMPGWAGYTEKPDREPSVIAEIEIVYENGERELICTDENWDTYTSNILFSELYDGENVDYTADIVLLGKATPDARQDYRLTEQLGETITEQERIAPVRLFKTPKGERVIDFGQNLAGYVEIAFKGEHGDRIVLSHAEVLDADGNFYTENMRTAKNLVSYVSDGEEHIFKPSFCFQGFRYVRLDEYPCETVDLDSIRAVAIYSDMKRTGYFECSDARLNRLYENVLWGQRSNFIDVPTDCPQRDERFGWTGDAEVFCRTAAINYDVEWFFRKWLTDMRMEQGEDGSIQGTCPKTRHDYESYVSAAWGDAATVCPYEIYRAYGSRDVLRENLEMMEKWVEYMHSFGDEEFLFIGGEHYGDWLGFDAGGEFGATQTDLIASAYFAYSTELVIRARRALSLDTSYHEELYKNVRSAFRAAFMKDGMPVIYPKADAFATNRPVKAMTQTSISLILRFGLCEESERELLTDRLVGLIRENGGKMSTGFVGTPHLLHALSQNGRSDVAYDLLLCDECPSWLYTVKMGATTMWEHWDGIKENGEFWNAGMNSFNHYAYGSVYDWMFGVMLGIDVDEDGGAGYRKIIYSPKTDARIDFARGSINTRLGKIESAWERLEGGKVRYELTLPDGVCAKVCIDGVNEQTVHGGKHIF